MNIKNYSLVINRYGRYMTFENADDLCAELKRYFTKVEQRMGAVDRLTTFSPGQFRDGVAKNSYQDFTVTAYAEQP